MSSKAAVTEMECGTSLAEDVWAVPSITTVASSNDGKKSKDDDAKPSSNSVEDAWTKIHELRSKLAADVISDPPSNNNGSRSGSNPHNFPTFISPYDQPKSNNGSTTIHQSHKGMTIPLIYCDQTASQRPVQSIENYIQSVSMPCHANTHTNITYTGSQSTAFVAEARQIVGESTGARITGKAALDTVIFGGNGVTGCVAILIDSLNLKGVVAASGDVGNANDFDKRPVVFVGPHEHHSNLLPWRESGCEVITIPERPSDGMVDLDHLETLLNLPQYNVSSGRLRMGAFSAVSNVTGIIADVDTIAIMLHKYGALAFFDYASGAPYLKMDMNPNPVQFGGEEVVDPSKDAIYFSPHKCYGGTSTPGVLVIKKHLISQTNPPSISGGGTVFYVTNQDHRFLSNRIERYEGGTPDGIGMQRVGLALLAGRRVANEYGRIVQRIVQSTVNEENSGDVVGKAPPKTLLEYECSTYDRVLGELKKHAPNLIMLGTNDNESNGNTREINSNSSCAGRHLPIFSFLIRCGPRFLHYNYVCAILNDVFGIQSRGGCQCAGPYSQRLLGLTTIVNSMEVPNNANRQIERALLRSDRPCELLRPGYTRLSLPFKGIREEEVDYVIQALVWVAKNGWILLPQYRCDHRTGEWRHWSRRGKPLGKSERRWLSHYDILAPFPSKQMNGSTVASAQNDSTTLASDNIKASRARLNAAASNANAILQSAKHDPKFLSEVEQMNSAHGMLGSGSNTDAGMGGIDDTLENLRWYVYQQEVSQYLRDGSFEEVPETFVDGALLGGIDVRMDGTRKSGSNNCDAVEVAGGSVEKMEVVPGDNVTSSEPTSPEQQETISSTVHPKKSDHIHFREGEDHAGEASYEEIKAGFDDGELSEACEVYSKGRDEWVSIEDFLRDYNDEEVADIAVALSGEGLSSSFSSKKRDLLAMEEDSSPSEGINSMKIDSLSAPPSSDDVMDVVSSPSPPVKQANSNSLPPAVEKREKKKPSRDSSQWGQFSAPHIAPSNPATGSSSVLATEEVGEDACLNTSVSATNTTVSSGEKVAMDNASLPAATKMSNKQQKNKGKVKPPQKMMRSITQAMLQWEMIQEGDRLLLGLSGGKDSLALLHCLLEFQRKLPIKFEIEVCTIDPMTPSFDPSPLIPYVEGLGLKYHYIKDDIVERANSSGKDGKIVSSLCAFCARMKRGNLYACARKNNCNKLVLAQHLDDCAESFFMSIMHNGFIRTMKAHYEINAGDVSVIRPLVYCRENLMTEFAKAENLPVINENCPACFEEPKERARIKKLLSREETLYPNLYDHIRRALIPVMHDDSTSIIRSYLEDTIAKSRKVPGKSKKAKITNNEMDTKSAATNPTTINGSEASTQNASASLESATEGELIAELARRRASKYKMSGAMKRLPNEDDEAANDKLPADETGQMCSLTGGDGMIPCRELME